MNKGDMSISAFSRRSLLSVKALRLYDEMGLLRPEHVDPSSKYRYYSEAQLETARLISLLRKLDVPLADISMIITQSPTNASQLLAAWWQGEIVRMAGKADLLRYIRSSVLGDARSDESSFDGYTVHLREVPAQTYLYGSRHLHGPELPLFVAETSRYLLARAAHYGGARGQISLMFHGQVDLDSDGPADVCLPIAAGAIAVGDDLIRTESAHVQAFTVLKEHQMAFPQILQVFQWMRRWIESNGYEISGLPREIHLGNVDTAQPNDAICEVAYPIQRTKGTTS